MWFIAVDVVTVVVFSVDVVAVGGLVVLLVWLLFIFAFWVRTVISLNRNNSSEVTYRRRVSMKRPPT